MTKFLYRLIYIWIVSAGIYSVLNLSIGEEYTGVSFLLSVYLLSLIFLAIKESGTTLRLILSGLLISPIPVLFIMSKFGRFYLTRELSVRILMIIFFSVLSVIAGELSRRFRFFRIPIACASVAVSALSLFVSIPLNRFFVIFTLFFTLIVLFEEIQRRWVRLGSAEGYHLVYVFPFLLISMICVMLSPVSDDPYDWHLVRKIYSDVSNAIEKIQWKFADNSIFDPSSSLIGFSESGEFHGSLASYDAPVMELDNISYGTRELRLRGKTFDTFTGTEWICTFTPPENESYSDTVSLLSSVNAFSNKPYDLVKRSHFTIQRNLTSADTVFAPLKTDLIRYDNTGGTVFYYYSLNSGSPDFKEYLANATLPDRSAFSGSENDRSYDEYIEYVDSVHEAYAGKPYLSEKLSALRDDIYDGASDSAEKLDRLSSYLNSLTYTVNPGDLPDHVCDESSFLDYFLLESETGYCSHFATAFVLLARAEGIPARYVQGYLVPVSENGKATVTNSMAHAWAEVYFDGAGWITYDPTPGFNVRSYWRTSSDPSAPDEQSSYQASAVMPEEDLAEDEPEAEEHFTVDKRLVLISCLVVLVITALMLIIYKLAQVISYNKKSPQEKYVAICRQILVILKLCGYGVTQGETVSEYKKRLPEGTLSDDFIDSLNRFLYNDADSDNESGEILINTKKVLLNRLKKDSYFKYLLFQAGIYGNTNYYCK